MSSKDVKAEVKLLDHQYKFVNSKSPFPALVGGFGCGKTEALVFRALSLMTKYGPMFKEKGAGEYSIGLYEPTYDLVQKILYIRIPQILESYKVDYQLNKKEKVIIVKKFNTRIILGTMENPEKIVGYEIADAILDELDTLSEEHAENVFTRVVSRARLKKPDGERNTVGVCTTPEGFRFCYKKWEKKEQENKEDFELIRGLTSNNIYLEADYIPNLKSLYPKNKLDAYLEGKFVNLIGNTVYDCFDRELNGKAINSDVSETLHVGMDFNVGKMSAVICVIRQKGKVKTVYAVDEVFGVLDTPAMITELNRRYKGRNLIIYPDSSGKNRKSVGASNTDISLLSEYFTVRARSKNPLVKNRVMAVQSKILNMNGDREFFVNLSKCKNLCENLEKQVYDDDGNPDKKSGTDHMLDALGYFIYWHFGLDKITNKILSKKRFGLQ